MTSPTILLQRSDGPRRGAVASLIALVLVALAATITVEQHRIQRTRERAAHAALTASNLAARQDTTRELLLPSSVAGDSLRLFQRRIVQIAQSRDGLDASLRAERAARYAMEATIDSLHRSLTASTADDTVHRWRFADFNLRRAPYTIEAHVEVPAPPDSASMSLRIQLDSLPIEARVSCSAPDENGIRAASLAATVPRWAAVRLRRVEQSPDVCASPALRRSDRGGVRWAPLVIGAGRAFAAGRSPSWAIFVGFGLAL